MRRVAVTVALVCVASLGLGVVLVVAGPKDPAANITICHETGSEKFEEITVDAESILSGHGHGAHPDDIIPPFTVIDNGVRTDYPGQNMNTVYGMGSRGPRSSPTDARCHPPRTRGSPRP